MRTVFTGNMAEEVFNVVIVDRRFVHFFYFLSIGSGTGTGIGKKPNDTHP